MLAQFQGISISISINQRSTISTTTSTEFSGELIFHLIYLFYLFCYSLEYYDFTIYPHDVQIQTHLIILSSFDKFIAVLEQMNDRETRIPIPIPFQVILQQPNESGYLGQQFFNKLIVVEQEYKKSASESKIQQLINLYSDCIHYFEANSEEVSVYFQHKMKKLLLNKRKFDQSTKIEQQVHSNTIGIPIGQKIQDHQQSIGKYQNKVMSIIDKQKQILAQRRMKKKTDFSKSSVFTMSMDSLFQSPEKSTGRPRLASRAKLFESLIDDDEDETSEKLS